MSLEPWDGYRRGMSMIRNRFVELERSRENEPRLMRAERTALHVRKIIEGVAYAALSAVEHRNQKMLAEQRTKDGDKLLDWLQAKGLLRLPHAQIISPPSL